MIESGINLPMAPGAYAPEPSTLVNLIRGHAPRFGKYVAVETLDGTSLTFRELLDKADAVACWLASQGVAPADRVGVCLPKSLPEVIVTLGILRLGAVLVNLSSKTPHRRIAEIAVETGWRWLFTNPQSARALSRDAKAAGWGIVVCGKTSAPVAETTAFEELETGGTIPESARTDGDLAAILYTSGSTGRSKGVMISHRNFISALHRLVGYLRNNSEDRILSILPFSAPWGLLQLLTMLHVGGCVTLQTVAFPAEIIRTIRTRKATGLAAMPPTWIQLTEHLLATGGTLPELRYITSSGGEIPRRVLEAFATVFPNAEVFLTYGLTEAFRSTLVPPDWFGRKMGSIGRPCDGVDIFVVEKGVGLCGPGQRGELIHRGDVVTLGYWNDPAATAACYRPCPELRSLFGDEPVHHSGDLVEIDADGFLWFVGRIEAQIKVAGHRVSAEEVERIAAQSGVVGHVVAFAEPDPVFGQVLALAVEPSDRYCAEVLLNHCREHLPSYAVPRSVHVWTGAMPVTGTGKINRDEVVRAVKGGDSHSHSR
jgi:acyl-CoA synthetase (AMP-forming)/AMP-acid ligase II